MLPGVNDSAMSHSTSFLSFLQLVLLNAKVVSFDPLFDLLETRRWVRYIPWDGFDGNLFASERRGNIAMK